MIDYRYRVYILSVVGKVFIFPFFLYYALLQIISRNNLFWIPAISRLPLYLLSIPVYWTIKNAVDLQVAELNAKRHGAILVPVCRGKLIGNIDILQRLEHNACLSET
jgi:hypothetical protein